MTRGSAANRGGAFFLALLRRVRVVDFARRRNVRSREAARDRRADREGDRRSSDPGRRSLDRSATASRITARTDNRALVPAVEKNSEDTIYDAASITKVVATAPSIWLLIQQGKVALDEPVKKYIPEFTGGWRDEITIRHLLTHTSGLRPDLTLTDKWDGFDEAWRRTMAEEVLQRPGAVFRYSDINYILLGEIVHRVSGEPLDQFARKHVFEPLGMMDSQFLPHRPDSSLTLGMTHRIAPTEMTDGVMLRGVVHDPTSRRMGGVAGHAGLFTTASDLAKFARALLNGGGGVFTPETVKQMTSVQSPQRTGVRRAGGFDIDSGFSRPRGELFPIGSFGHTGWTGGMIWIDPYSRTFYVFLSNRVHPDGKGNVLPLQRDLGTLVAQSVRGFDFTNVPGALPKRAGGGVRVMTGGADAQNGIDVLVASKYAALRGMRVGLITNHTGIDRSGQSDDRSAAQRAGRDSRRAVQSRAWNPRRGRRESRRHDGRSHGAADLQSLRRAA